MASWSPQCERDSRPRKACLAVPSGAARPNAANGFFAILIAAHRSGWTSTGKLCAFVKSDIDRWRQVVASGHIKVEEWACGRTAAPGTESSRYHD